MKQNKMKISIKWNLQNLFCKPLAYFHLANSRFLLSKSLAYFHYTNSRISFCFVLFHFISLIVKPILLVSTNGNISKSIENMHTDIRSQSKRIPLSYLCLQKDTCTWPVLFFQDDHYMWLQSFLLVENSPLNAIG